MEMLVNAFMKKYPAQGRILVAYEKAVGEPPAWDNITKANLHAFTEQLCNEVSNNSARTYIKMFKSVLNMYSDVVDLPQDYKAMLKVKGETTVSVYLDNHDIDRLISYEANSKYEDVVRNQFVLGCLTGARYSDYLTFSSDNIVGNKIVYVSEKTKIKSEIPLAPAVRRIIENQSQLGYAYNRTDVERYRKEWNSENNE